MCIQPYKGNQRVIVEPRNPDGTLNVASLGDMPTNLVNCTFDQVYEHYFRSVPDGAGTWDNLRAWLSSKGWTIRARYW